MSGGLVPEIFGKAWPLDRSRLEYLGKKKEVEAKVRDDGEKKYLIECAIVTVYDYRHLPRDSSCWGVSSVVQACWCFCTISANRLRKEKNQCQDNRVACR